MNAFIEYIRSAQAELEKVSWPSRQDTIRYGGLVIGASVMSAAFFAALDFGLQHTVKAVLTARQQNAPAAPASAPSTVPTPAPEIQLNPTSVEGVDKNGKPANIKVETVPINGGAQVSP